MVRGLAVMGILLLLAAQAQAGADHSQSLPLIVVPTSNQPGTPTNTATPTRTKTATPTDFATNTPTVSNTPTNTPVPPTPTFNGCVSESGPFLNYPARIEYVSDTTVEIRNMRTSPTSVTGWRLCSIGGNNVQTLVGVFGLGGGAAFAGNYPPGLPVALYDAQGSLISYMVR